MTLAMVALAAILAGCGGGSDDTGGSEGSSGGNSSETATETVPLDSEERGCYDDPKIVGCSENPAPAGTAFEDDSSKATVTYVSGIVAVAPSDDPVNQYTYTATVTLNVTNQDTAERLVEQFPWQVSIGVGGDTLDGCGLQPREGTVAPGESIELTQTCSIDLGGDGSVDPENWTVELVKNTREADLELQAA